MTNKGPEAEKPEENEYTGFCNKNFEHLTY